MATTLEVICAEIQKQSDERINYCSLQYDHDASWVILDGNFDLIELARVVDENASTT